MSCFNIKLVRVGGMDASVERVGDFSASVKRVGGLSCQLWQVCSTNIRKPYLEINPTIVWVLAGYTSNDVFSNTTWNIE